MCINKYISFIFYAEEGQQWLVVIMLAKEMEADKSAIH